MERVQSYFASDFQQGYLELEVPSPERVQLCFNHIRKANQGLCDTMMTSYRANPIAHKELHALFARVGGPFFVNLNILADLGLQQPSSLKYDFSLYGVFYHGQAKVCLSPQLSYDASSARTKLSISLDIW